MNFLDVGQRKQAIPLIKQAHKIAITYNLIHLAGELSSVLYQHHVYHDQSSRKRANAMKYAAQMKYYLQEYLAEKHAEDLFFRVGNLSPTKNQIN